jgi:hypothetical protein
MPRLSKRLHTHTPEEKARKDSFREGELVLEDKLALEATMDSAPEGEIEKREEFLLRDTTAKRLEKEIRRAEDLAWHKENIDKKTLAKSRKKK